MDAIEAALSDDALLEKMLERDFLPSDVFRRACGDMSGKEIAQYSVTKILPEEVRQFCRDALASKHPA